ncbi:MAG: hypothetical protein N838_22580 [Thiohalocapsa sp. PB-PSB1]|jgi:hypothetical protein|nr:MAG: hypothetical protein N838_22580 [Thiohalocapsa sp. PB-PSB1]
MTTTMTTTTTKSLRDLRSRALAARAVACEGIQKGKVENLRDDIEQIDQFEAELHRLLR